MKTYFPHTLRNGMAILGLMMLPLAAQAAGPRVPSVHVSYSGDMPLARSLFKSMEASLKGACGGKLSISGSASLLGRLRSDVYFSRDGAYIAQIDEHYIGKPTGRCSLSIQPVQRKRLYHLKTNTQYRYEENGRHGPVWRSFPLPGKGVALFMEDNLGPSVGKVTATGKEDKFAGFSCAYSEFLFPDGRRAGEYCDHDLSADGIRVPTHIRLQSRTFNVQDGELTTQRQADTVELDALVDISVFQPGKGVSDAPRKVSPAMRKWCDKQHRETGVDPCQDDPEDDED
jgi:hypothetical protein